MLTRLSAARVLRPWLPHSSGRPSLPRRRRSGRSSTQADFLKGDVENLSIDSDGRLFLGPATALVAETSAPVPLDAARGRRRHAVGRHRQRRKGPEDRAATARPRRSSTRRARGARAGAGAQRRPLRRHLARRQDLPGRRGRHVASLLRSRRQVHLGARGRRRRQRSSPPPARRASSTRSRRTARARSSTRPTRRNVVALAFDKRGQPDRRHRIARPGLPHRSRPARRSCCSTRRSRRFTR